MRIKVYRIDERGRLTLRARRDASAEDLGRLGILGADGELRLLDERPVALSRPALRIAA